MAQEHRVDHHISFPRRQNQYVAVRSRIPVNSEVVELIMPTWTPGSYLIRDFSAHVENFLAKGPDGNALPVKKISKNRWQINSAGER